MVPMSASLTSARTRTLVEVGHLDQRRAAAERAGGRRDDLAERNRLLDDGAGDRRAHRRVLETLLREVEVRARANELRLRVRVVERRGLVLLRRDDARLEQVVGALLLRFGDLQLRLGRADIGQRLVVLVLHVARVELHDQVARLDQRARLDRHLRDLPRGLRLHLDDVDRLDGAGGRCVDDDVAALDRGGRDRDARRLLARAGDDARRRLPRGRRRGMQ